VWLSGPESTLRRQASVDQNFYQVDNRRQPRRDGVVKCKEILRIGYIGGACVYDIK
jgi:hypothetical protein